MYLNTTVEDEEVLEFGGRRVSSCRFEETPRQEDSNALPFKDKIHRLDEVTNESSWSSFSPTSTVNSAMMRSSVPACLLKKMAESFDHLR